MPKCSHVGCKNEAIFAWQPFGPDSSPTGTFTTLGNHYRGFPVLKVCQEDHDAILSEIAVLHFVYKTFSYWWNSAKKHFEQAPF